jgi:hypothetical protein
MEARDILHSFTRLLPELQMPQNFFTADETPPHSLQVRVVAGKSSLVRPVFSRAVSFIWDYDVYAG